MTISDIDKARATQILSMSEHAGWRTVILPIVESEIKKRTQEALETLDGRAAGRALGLEWLLGLPDMARKIIEKDG
jgi:hypothetical protein